VTRGQRLPTLPGLLQQLYLTVRAQAGFHEFGAKHVAAEATLYLRSEPAQLDEFVRAIREVSDGQRDDATLECL
jgi:hypothetical protein